MENSNQNNRSGVKYLVIFFTILVIVFLINKSPNESTTYIDAPKHTDQTIKTETKLPTIPADIAISFVYDTSGSMNDKVLGKNGSNELKYVIANRALDNVVDRLKLFADDSNKGALRTVHIGLLGFNNIQYPIEKLNVSKFKKWLSQIPGPRGGTPLGKTINRAGVELLKVNALHRHILVLTDGLNTEGENPSSVIPKLKKLASANGTSIEVHIIGFDVADSVFNPLKKEGVNVFSAINENELTLQLDKLLNEKILLEDDDSPTNVTPK